MNQAHKPDPVISVVVPVFNEEQGLAELHGRLRETLAEIEGDHEILYVNDGSTDRSAELIEGWATTEDDVVLVELSRNFGMEVAMSSGIDHARGRYVVLMHADLQDPPELIPRMLAAGEEGADVVYARRIGRDESALKRTLATAFYGVMARLARVPYQGQAGDFRMMSRRVVETLQQMPERRRFLRGMVAWVGLNQVPVEYRRAGRTSGRGASYPELFRLAAEAIASFSDVPLQLSTYLGLFTAALSATAAVLILALSVAQVISTTIELWVLVSVLFLGGVQLISIGILGRYLARVHDESLRRPLYVVSRVVSTAGSRPASGELARAAEPR
ncbi:MAG: polyisoprenyl-phosphate glycosyltransferase [Thermoleophilaceae bacterium]|nr:polyisoprenyl-phosphate glycosyltransferase [Thermoleophilaceae bacterium]